MGHNYLLAPNKDRRRIGSSCNMRFKSREILRELNGRRMFLFLVRKGVVSPMFDHTLILSQFY